MPDQSTQQCGSRIPLLNPKPCITTPKAYSARSYDQEHSSYCLLRHSLSDSTSHFSIRLLLIAHALVCISLRCSTSVPLSLTRDINRTDALLQACHTGLRPQTIAPRSESSCTHRTKPARTSLGSIHCLCQQRGCDIGVATVLQLKGAGSCGS